MTTRRSFLKTAAAFLGALPLVRWLPKGEEVKVKLQEVLERAYYSEINVEIYSFWDAGWTVKLGDKMNGYKDASGIDMYDQLIETDELADIIHKMILKHYPDSEYSTTHGEGRSKTCQT